MTTIETTTAILRVASHSPVHATAGSIAATLRQHGHATVQAIGAGAVNQMVKALAVAAQFLVEDGLMLHCVPSYRVKGKFWKWHEAWKALRRFEPDWTFNRRKTAPETGYGVAYEDNPEAGKY